MSEITAYSRNVDVHSTGTKTEYEISVMKVHGKGGLPPLAEPNMNGVVYGPETLTEDLCIAECPIAKRLINGVRCSKLNLVHGPSNNRVEHYTATATADNFEHLKVVNQPNNTTRFFPNEFDEMASGNSLPCQKGGMIFPDQVVVEQGTLATPTVE